MGILGALLRDRALFLIRGLRCGLLSFGICGWNIYRQCACYQAVILFIIALWYTDTGIVNQLLPDIGQATGPLWYYILEILKGWPCHIFPQFVNLGKSAI